MGKEKTTVKLEKHEPDTRPFIVGEVKKSVRRMRTVKSKEKIKITASKSKSITDKDTTTCETSGNLMRLCVNLMPVLASAKEEEEEETEKEENWSEKERKTSRKNSPTLDTSDFNTGLTLDTATETKPSPSPTNPLFLLPPITQPKPSPTYRDHLKSKRFLTPLPPVSLSDKTTIISTKVTGHSHDCGGDAPVTGQVPDSRPWLENPLLSKSRSAEFRLPDISLSSLDALLQTVTQKLGRRKKRGGDEEPWRLIGSDHLLMTDSEHDRGRKVWQQINTDKISGETTKTPAVRRSVNSERSLPLLFSAPKPTLILTMTKKNLLASSTLQ